MNYIALVIVIIALCIGCLCGILENILARKKRKSAETEIKREIEVSIVETMIPAQRLLLAGNVALIEERYDTNLNALMDDMFGEYEENK